MAKQLIGARQKPRKPPDLKKPETESGAQSPAFRFRLRIFFAADLVGSTAYKQSSTKHAYDAQTSPEEIHLGNRTIQVQTRQWRDTMLNFFREMETEHTAVWSSTLKECTKSEYGSLDSVKPQLWKTLGDEVVYECEITDQRHIPVLLRIWMETVRNCRSNLKKKTPTLDIKGHAWIAGFPVSNTEIALQKSLENAKQGKATSDPYVDNIDLLNKHYAQQEASGGYAGNGLEIDYIGPSMDTGFRLGSEATSRKFLLSVDLAFLLFTSLHSLENKDATIAKPFETMVFYEGRRSLKGVNEGSPYPIFWIDMANGEIIVKREDILMKRTNIEFKIAREFCREYLSKNPYIGIPFIEADPSTLKEDTPKVRLARERDGMKQKYEDIKAKSSPTVEPKDLDGSGISGEELRKVGEMLKLAIKARKTQKPAKKTRQEKRP